MQKEGRRRKGKARGGSFGIRTLYRKKLLGEKKESNRGKGGRRQGKKGYYNPSKKKKKYKKGNYYRIEPHLV